MRLVFDGSAAALRAILRTFWTAQDHTAGARSGLFMDGYSSVVIVYSDAHHAIALQSRAAVQRDLRARRAPGAPSVSVAHVEVLRHREGDPRTRYFRTASRTRRGKRTKAGSVTKVG